MVSQQNSNQSSLPQKQHENPEEEKDYTKTSKDHICLSCGQPMEWGRTQVTKSEDGKIVSKCPVCTEEGQIASFEELAETESFQNFIKQFERRPEEEV